jgi:hypothetical protein
MDMSSNQQHKSSLTMLWQSYWGNKNLGDVKILAFILEHGFHSDPISVASIGLPSREELFTGNCLVRGDASIVLFGTEVSREYKASLNALADQAFQLGSGIQTQVADLAIPGRWAQLLPAMSTRQVGILGVDAVWAASEPNFWKNLSEFWGTGKSVLYIRGLLDYHIASAILALLSALPKDGKIELVAATPTSLWLAPAGDFAQNLRSSLNSSRLGNIERLTGDDGPVLVGDDWVRGVVDDDGRVARCLFRAEDENLTDLCFDLGWSLPESDGRWIEGAEATLRITLPENLGPISHVILIGNGWVPPNDGPQNVSMGVGDEPAAWVKTTLFDGSAICDCRLALSPSDVASNRLTLQFKVEKPGRPSDYGESDERMLGYKLRSVGLF